MVKKQTTLPAMPSARLLLLSISLMASAMAPTSGAEIYRWTDAEGKVHFSDEAPKKSKARKLEKVEKVETRLNTFTPVAVEPREAAVIRKPVIMYVTTWCGYCKKARRYFRANNIRFKEYDIEKSAAAKRRFKRLGGRGVPLILVGKKRMSGFSESGFRSIYKSS